MIHISVSKVSHHCFNNSLLPIQCKPGNKLWWTLSKHTTVFYQEYKFENVVWQMVAIRSHLNVLISSMPASHHFLNVAWQQLSKRGRANSLTDKELHIQIYRLHYYLHYQIQTSVIRCTCHMRTYDSLCVDIHYNHQCSVQIKFIVLCHLMMNCSATGTTVKYRLT